MTAAPPSGHVDLPGAPDVDARRRLGRLPDGAPGRDARVRSRARGTGRTSPSAVPGASRRLRGRRGHHGLRDHDRCDGRARRAARGRPRDRGIRRRICRPAPASRAVGGRRRGGGIAAYAAPVVASGEATFAGYVKLDDTATWLGMLDYALEHGTRVTGLAPSSYEAMLTFWLGDGYPLGSFLPLGVTRLLARSDDEDTRRAHRDDDLVPPVDADGDRQRAGDPDDRRAPCNGGGQLKPDLLGGRAGGHAARGLRDVERHGLRPLPPGRLGSR